MRGKSEALGIRVPSELRVWLEQRAAQERRTVSQLCRLILEDFAEGRLVPVDKTKQ